MACEVDSDFIQPLERRPGPEFIVAEAIPIIDLSPLASPNSLSDGDPAVVRLINEIADACQKWGFFQVINHGIPPSIRQSLESCSRRFFALPADEKRKARRDAENPYGYYDMEHTKNFRDWKEVFDFAVKEQQFIPTSHELFSKEVHAVSNRWPISPPELRQVAKAYAREVEKLAFTLLELISRSLGLPPERLNRYFDDQTSFIRLNYYSPCPTPHLALGVGPHKDAGALTVLAQDDVGGLEVKRKSDGQWVRVLPFPNAYIINVGDIIQVWSNDKYESVEHRVVVNSLRERFSIPFFFNPAHHVMVQPLEDLVNQKNPPKYKAYNWGKFFKTRKLSNFKKLSVENIQICHFEAAE